MKQRGGRRKAASKKISDDAAAVSAKLQEIDIMVDQMKLELEEIMEPIISEMKKEVTSLLLRLPPRVKAMRMSDFLQECGGDVSLLLEKERKMARLAKTAAKAGSGRTTSLASKILSNHRNAMINQERKNVASLGNNSASTVNLPKGLSTPRSSAFSGHDDGVAEYAETVPVTPSTHAREVHFATPGSFVPSSYLPKTPIVPHNQLLRKTRRNEMVFHAPNSGTQSLDATENLPEPVPPSTAHSPDEEPAALASVQLNIGNQALDVADVESLLETATDLAQAAKLADALAAIQQHVSKVQAKLAEVHGATQLFSAINAPGTVAKVAPATEVRNRGPFLGVTARQQHMQLAEQQQQVQYDEMLPETVLPSGAMEPIIVIKEEKASIVVESGKDSVQKVDTHEGINATEFVETDQPQDKETSPDPTAPALPATRKRSSKRSSSRRK